MTDKLEPFEIYAEGDEDYETPSVLDTYERVVTLIRELATLAPRLPTLPEMTDADEALRALRHLRRQLEGS
jgi:hypothetical protein